MQDDREIARDGYLGLAEPDTVDNCRSKRPYHDRTFAVQIQWPTDDDVT